MNEILKINYDADRITLSARDLHNFLEVGSKYNDWFKRMCEYGFNENVDYRMVTRKKVTNNPKNPYATYSDHEITIDMAKEISMLQRNEKGKQARQYFIEVEKQWNSPERVIARGLIESQKMIDSLNQQVIEMKPKADYFDQLVNRNLLTNFRDTSKELRIAPKKFIEMLLEDRYIYRDQKGKLKPYQEHLDKGLFELKEFTSRYSNHADLQTLITPRGRETFRLLYAN